MGWNETGGGGPLVDRRDSFDTLLTAFESTVDGRDCIGDTVGGVLVSGPFGIGKTTLVEAAIHEFSSTVGALHRPGVFTDNPATPYRGIGEAISPVLDPQIVEVFEPNSWDSSVGAPDHLVFSPEEFDEQRRNFYATIADGLLERTADAPVVLFVDDLQAATAPSVELLRFLAQRAVDTPLTVVTAVNPATVGDDQPAMRLLDEWSDSPDHVHVSLDEFDRGATGSLVESTLQRANVPDPFVDEILTHSGGNPLYVHHLIAALVETDRLDPNETEFPPDGDALVADFVADLPADRPDDLTALIGFRLDQLDANARTVLETAALLGRSIPRDLLVQATSLPEAAVRDQVAVFVDAGLFRIGENEEDTLQFASHTLYETIHRQLASSREEELHREIAAAIGNEPAEIDLRARRVYHLLEASDPDAVPDVLAVGRWMESMYAHENARDLYEQALDLAEAVTAAGDADTAVDEAAIDTADRLAVMESIGDVARATGDRNRARQAYKTVQSAAGEASIQARACRKRAELAIDAGGFSRAIDHAEAGLETTDEKTAERCRLFGVLATAAIEQGRHQTAIVAARKQLRLARVLGIATLEASALRTLAIAARYEDETDMSREFLERSLDAARGAEGAQEADGAQEAEAVQEAEGSQEAEAVQEVEGVQEELESLLALGNLEYFEGNYDDARQHFEDARAASTASGNRSGEAVCLNNLGSLALERGQYEDSREYLEASRSLDRELLDEEGRLETLSNIAESYRYQGAFDRAEAYHERALALARELDDASAIAASQQLLGLVALDRGDPERARSLLEEALEIHRDQETEHQEARCRCGLAEALMAAGEYERADPHLREASDIAIRLGIPDVLGIARLSQARRALSAEQFENAREHASEARDLFEDVGQVHREARARLLLARIDRLSGSPENARTNARAALDTFEAVDAPQDQLRAIRELIDSNEAAGDTEQAREWCLRALEVLDGAPAGTRDRHHEWVETRAVAFDLSDQRPD